MMMMDGDDNYNDDDEYHDNHDYHDDDDDEYQDDDDDYDYDNHEDYENDEADNDSPPALKIQQTSNNRCLNKILDLRKPVSR